ncbi:MAG: long-chain fatty acid--CoA ligase [Bacteroidetes Order II. Incertae sedis bacterium]|nr:long-chain fatty acid--CoA ligase [Bacteroidetes Order II. bacterium]
MGKAIVSFNSVPEMFFRLAEHYANAPQPALSFKNKQKKTWEDISWPELRANIEAVAAYLYHKGVRKGDRVAILSENRPEWTITDAATQLLGGINVSLYTTLPASEVAYILKDSGSKVFLVSTGIQLRKAEDVFEDCPELKEVISMTVPKKTIEYVSTWADVVAQGKTLWPQYSNEIMAIMQGLTPNDISALIYTSGTTGNPKGVMLTHENFCSQVEACLPKIEILEGDLHLSFLPLSHSFEQTAGYHALLAAGGRVAYAESVEAVINNLSEVHPTVLISVPRVFERAYNVIMKNVEEGSPTKKKIFAWALATGQKVADARGAGKKPNPILAAQYTLATKLVFSKIHQRFGGRVRFAISGGAALPAPIGNFFNAAGIPVIEGYGLTETAPVLSINPMNSPRYGTVGHVIPGVTVAIQRLSDNKIIGALTGEDYPSNLTTEEGEIICKGPNIMKGYWNNEKATSEVIDADGWFHTGDVGKFEDGYLRITDRIKHMLVSKGGKNIYPGPIEDRFKTNQLVDQIIVIGEAREFLTALVVPNMENLSAWAKNNGVSVAQPSSLITHKAVQDEFTKTFREYSKKAASHEKIRDFRFIEEPFSVENGMMTPTLKLKRKIIEQRYTDLIDQMYQDV